ncbi:hypothetical protein [Herbaspirillum huttiense]|uniref:hypothetical protein n=1 Tax=Herbaspirillum huttiense TaxID=863372 RepID=UPI0039AEE04A
MEKLRENRSSDEQSSSAEPILQDSDRDFVALHQGDLLAIFPETGLYKSFVRISTGLAEHYSRRDCSIAVRVEQSEGMPHLLAVKIVEFGYDNAKTEREFAVEWFDSFETAHKAALRVMDALGMSAAKQHQVAQAEKGAAVAEEAGPTDLPAPVRRPLSARISSIVSDLLLPLALCVAFGMFAFGVRSVAQSLKSGLHITVNVDNLTSPSKVDPTHSPQGTQ